MPRSSSANKGNAMNKLMLALALGALTLLAAGYSFVDAERPPRPDREELPDPPLTVAASPAPSAVTRIELRASAAPPTDVSVAAPAAAVATSAADPAGRAATRSAAWESLRLAIDARLEGLAGSPARQSSVEFTDAVKRAGIELAALSDQELADLFDGFARLSVSKAAEREPLTSEGRVPEAGDEPALAAIDERYRLCEQDLLHGF